MVQILAEVRNGKRLYARNGVYVLAPAPREDANPPEGLLPEEVQQLIDIGLLAEEQLGVLRAGPNLI